MSNKEVNRNNYNNRKLINNKLPPSPRNTLAYNSNLAKNPYHLLQNDDDDDDYDDEEETNENQHTMAADSGCTIHLANNNIPLRNEIITPIGIKITTASSHSIHGTSQGHLPINNLPPEATECHRVPNINMPLFSIGQSCDAECIAIFDKEKVIITKTTDVAINHKKSPILEGKRQPNGLWTLDIPKTTTLQKVQPLIAPTNNNNKRTIIIAPTNNNNERTIIIAPTNNNHIEKPTIAPSNNNNTKSPIIAQTNNNLPKIPITAPSDNNNTKNNNNVPRPFCANSAYHQKNKKELAIYLHAAAGYPPIVTFCKAIDNGYYATWPGLTSELIRKHLPKSVSTIMGRQKRMRQGIRSTSKQEEPPPAIEDLPLEPPRTNIDRTHQVGAIVLNFEDLKGTICTDLPGRFPFHSSRGMNYIFILYDFDSNAILAEPIKSRNASHLVDGYDACYNLLTKAGIKPILHRLDNEVSQDLIASIEAKGLKYQLATPHDHRNNYAERAIQTFKNHFISIMNGCDIKFPPHLWCRLIYQAVITLNMLRRSRINPKLSAYNQIFGNFDFNATPLAPCGMKAIIYEKKEQRISTWSDHGAHGWYVGPAPQHYRNYTVYVNHSRDERTSDTVDFFPTKFAMPKTSSNDRAIAAIEDLAHELRNPKPASPFLQRGTPTNDAYRKLEELLKNIPSGESPRVPESTDAESPRVPRDPGQDPPRVPPKHARPEFAPGDTRRHTRGQATTKPISEQQANHFGSTKGWGRALNAILEKEEEVTAFTNLDHLAATAEHHCFAVTHPVTGKQMEYRHLIRDPDFKEEWLLSGANEFGRLAQGVGGRIKGTNTIFFIHKNQVPQGRTVTYARTVCSVRPEKDEKNRTRITAGGNLITDYPGNISTETAGLETIKIHWNSVLSTPGAKWMGMDISNMYLNTPLDRFEYMRYRLCDIPQEIIDEYNLNEKVADDGYIYIEIRRAVPGLRQSGALAHQQLKLVLGKEGYYASKFTPGLFLHQTRPISFTLVVDDFGVKYVNKADALHLEKTLQNSYPMKSDWKGERYIGIDLDWDYEERTLKTSMKDYVKNALLQFQHELPNQHHYAPSKYIPPRYGSKQQMTKIDTSAPITEKQKKFLQQVTGKFLYYARAIDDTMLHNLNDLATAISNGTQETMKAVTHFLNYCASNPDAVKLYRASDMWLYVDSDAAYLVARMARSRVGGFHYLGNRDGKLINGSINVLAKLIKNVMSSAAEAECGGLYMNAKAAVPERTTLIELGHPQPPTPLKTDNSTADGIMNKTVKQQRSKAIDMRFYWLQDRCEQGQFRVYWAPGVENLADYYTKHHPPSLHRRVRSIYLYTPDSTSDMQGCIKKLIQQPTKSTPNISNKPARHKRVTFRLPLQTSKATVAAGIANDKTVGKASRSISDGIAKYTNQLLCALQALQ